MAGCMKVDESQGLWLRVFVIGVEDLFNWMIDAAARVADCEGSVVVVNGVTRRRWW